MSLVRKRAESQDTLERDDLPLVAGVMQVAGEAAKQAQETPPKDEEKLSLFWRVFGGTILSIAALVAVTLYNNLLTGVSDLRAELNRANEARTQAVADLRAELAKSSETRVDYVKKEEFNNRLSSNWNRIQTAEKLNSDQAASLGVLKTEIDSLKERLTRQTTELEAARKELSTAIDKSKRDQTATLDGMKKDFAVLEVVKERLGMMAGDFKSTRDDLAKLRVDVEKNQSNDNERKERRDAQYKLVDESMKELQKGLQDCREKLARLEGRFTPVPDSPAPPKQTRAEPRTKTPIVPASGTKPVDAE